MNYHYLGVVVLSRATSITWFLGCCQDHHFEKLPQSLAFLSWERTKAIELGKNIRHFVSSKSCKYIFFSWWLGCRPSLLSRSYDLHGNEWQNDDPRQRNNIQLSPPHFTRLVSEKRGEEYIWMVCFLPLLIGDRRNADQSCHPQTWRVAGACLDKLWRRKTISELSHCIVYNMTTSRVWDASVPELATEHEIGQCW